MKGAKRERAKMEMMEEKEPLFSSGCARLRAWVGRDLFFQQMMTTI